MKKKLLVVLLSLFFLGGCAIAPKALKLNKLGPDSVLPAGTAFVVQVVKDGTGVNQEIIEEFEGYLKERLTKHEYYIDPNAQIIMKVAVKKWREEWPNFPFLLGGGFFLKVEYTAQVDIYKNGKLLSTGDIETNFSTTSNHRPFYVMGEYPLMFSPEGYTKASRRAFAELIVRGLTDLAPATSAKAQTP